MSRPEVIARHISICMQRLGEALHYHRYFGHPIQAFSREHNRARAEINDRTVRALATIAGEFLAYSGYAPGDAFLFGEIVERALRVGRINAAFIEGYHTTSETMGVASGPIEA